MQCSCSSVVSLPFLPNLVESFGLSFFQLDLLSLEGADFDGFSEREESADLELLLLLVLLDDLLSFFEGGLIPIEFGREFPEVHIILNNAGVLPHC